jgi:AcrR family transcriptional regulator
MARHIRTREGGRREEIATAAARLFREKGFSGTGMRDLAGSVGIEAASLYNHIDSKAGLLREICFRIADDCSSHLRDLEATPGLDSLRRLESITRFHVRMWIDRLDEVLVATNEFRSLEEPWLEKFLQERRMYMKQVETIISQGIREGLVRPLEPYVVVLTIMSAVRGIEFWHRSRKNVSAASLEESMVDLIVNGIRNDNAGTSDTHGPALP